MEKSKVYFTDFRAKPGYNLLQKLEKLSKKAGIENIDFKNKYADLVNEQTAFENSNLGEHIKQHIKEKDNFHINHPDTHWESQIEHGEKIGLGSSEYELIEIK